MASSKKKTGKDKKAQTKNKKDKSESDVDRPDKKLKLRAVRLLADEKAFGKVADMLSKDKLKGVALVERNGDYLIGIKADDKKDNESYKAYREFKVKLKEGGLLYQTPRD